jgi:hypothetical protein
MKKIVFAGAALAVLAAAPAVAQPDEGRLRSAQPQTRSAVAAQVEARFARADGNRDGFVTQEEVGVRSEAGSAEFEAPRALRGGGMRGGFGGRGFALMDLNGDGRVDLAEAQRAALQRFDRVDSNRDGTISPDERQTARAARAERMQERRGERRED